jgi:hypothetical protein
VWSESITVVNALMTTFLLDRDRLGRADRHVGPHGDVAADADRRPGHVPGRALGGEPKTVNISTLEPDLDLLGVGDPVGAVQDRVLAERGELVAAITARGSPAPDARARDYPSRQPLQDAVARASCAAARCACARSRSRACAGRSRSASSARALDSVSAQRRGILGVDSSALSPSRRYSPLPPRPDATTGARRPSPRAARRPTAHASAPEHHSIGLRVDRWELFARDDAGEAHPLVGISRSRCSPRRRRPTTSSVA